MDFNSAIYQFVRILIWLGVGVMALWNARRIRGLARVHRVLLGVLELSVAVSTWLAFLDNPDRSQFSTIVFTPLLVAFFVVEFLSLVNFRVGAPFNRRENDL